MSEGALGSDENFYVLKSDVLQGIGYLLTHDEWIFWAVRERLSECERDRERRSTS